MARLVRSLGFIACVAVVGCSGDDGTTDGGTGSGASSVSTSGASTTASSGMTATDGSSGGGSGTDSASSGSSGGMTESSASGTSASGTETMGSTATDSSGSSGGTTMGGSATTDATGVTGSTTMEPPPGVCGDGMLNAGEECDEGADNAPDGNCLPDCTNAVCGDGVKATAEECDLGPMNSDESGCSVECKILPSACGNQQADAKLVPKPVDIIILIDNSGSMAAEIAGVESNINKNFAEILGKSGLDYRVIMVSAYGKNSSYRVCVEAPLGGIPQGGCANPPAQPVNNPGKFYHYSLSISSTNSWCQALASYDGAVKDQFNFAPTGWKTWLRDDAFKVFLEVTDDRVSCSYGGKSYSDGGTVAGGLTAATAFDASLVAKSPLHFGPTVQKRNYAWYSIVGLAYNNPKDKAYTPMDPVITAKCPSAVNAGTGYQSLSNLTGGLKNPLCDPTIYDSLFVGIAQNVISEAKLQCDFDLPIPPMDKVLDMDSILVEFTPEGQNDPVVFKKVASPDMCDAMSFYVENDKVILCPQACDLVQGQKGAQLEVNFTCEPLKPN